jgi:hypothetical protein
MAQASTNEYPPCIWSELTTYEQNEAITRGFSRERGTRYIAKRRYDQDAGELSLVRWTSAQVSA